MPTILATKSMRILNKRFCCTQFRRLSTISDNEHSATHAFDRSYKLKQRDNAARAYKKWQNGTAITDYDYLRVAMAEKLIDRLDDIKRDEGFPLALDIGAGPGYIYDAICAQEALQETGGGIGGVRKLVQVDSSHETLHRTTNAQSSNSEIDYTRCDTYRLVADEEVKLPFPDGTFDVVFSSGSLHWVNKLPLLFKEVSRVLKPDGAFMLAMIGGNSTLPELTASLVLAELERDGGVSTHVGPFVELPDIGALLQRAGFTLPTLDVDTVRVAMPHAGVLMEHLQRMGDNNASVRRKPRTSLDTFLAASCIYDNKFKASDGNDDEIEASVQVIYAIGWTPHESQQKPLERGTATRKMGDFKTDDSTA